MHYEMLMPYPELSEVRPRLPRPAQSACMRTRGVWLQVQHAQLVASHMEFFTASWDIMLLRQAAARSLRQEQLFGTLHQYPD
jgi:hypothetical protein